MYRYNNVANNIEFVQVISRASLCSGSPGKKFTYQVGSLINSSWQMVFTSIDKLLNQHKVNR